MKTFETITKAIQFHVSSGRNKRLGLHVDSDGSSCALVQGGNGENT
jgi:hypothetical protein